MKTLFSQKNVEIVLFFTVGDKWEKVEYLSESVATFELLCGFFCHKFTIWRVLIALTRELFLASLIYAVNSTRASPKPGWERRVGHGARNSTPWKTPWLKGLHKLHWMTKGNGPRERAYEAAQPNPQGNYHYKLNWSPSAWPGRRWRGQLKTKRWKLPVWTLCSRGNDKE